MLIFSFGDFLVKLDKNDKGKTKAALPSRTNPKSIELTPIDVPGLIRKAGINSWIQQMLKIVCSQLVLYNLGMQVHCR